MTFEELMVIFKKAAREGMSYFEYDHEKGVRAVIVALRDDLVNKGYNFGWNASDFEDEFNDILGDAGEKAAGGPTREDGQAAQPGQYAPAADFFSKEAPEWSKDPFNEDMAATCGTCGAWMSVVRPGKHQCDNPDCNSPAANPSPAVCEWTDGGDVWNTPCMPPDELLTTETFNFCPSCGKPVRIVEGK